MVNDHSLITKCYGEVQYLKIIGVWTWCYNSGHENTATMGRPRTLFDRFCACSAASLFRNIKCFGKYTMKSFKGFVKSLIRSSRVDRLRKINK